MGIFQVRSRGQHHQPSMKIFFNCKEVGALHTNARVVHRSRYQMSHTDKTWENVVAVLQSRARSKAKSCNKGLIGKKVGGYGGR